MPDCTAQTVTIQAPQGQPAEQAITYSYDALSRLVAADYDSGVYFHYSYDAAGNRLEAAEKLAAEVDEVVNTYTYDAANRQTSANGVAYTWDANGNLLNDGQYTYRYDSANRLSAVEKGAYNASYAYNGLGDRVRQTANGVTTQYTLDLNSGLTQVLTENTPGGYGDETYLYGLARLAQVSAESTEYFAADALGSVRQLTDANADVTLQRSYTPYGEILRASGTGKTNYGFTGESFDPQTGLAYLRARYYSAGQGRFISKDTWAGDANLPLSYNRWAYGYDNPVRFVDPSGYKAKEDWNIFQIKLYQRGFNKNIITGDRPIGFNHYALDKQDMLLITWNFETNPSPSDIHCYNPELFINSFDPDQYDWLFSGWADYWQSRAISSDMPESFKYVLTADFLKAMAYAENSMGTTDTDLFNLGWNEIHRLDNQNADASVRTRTGEYREKTWLQMAMWDGMGWYLGEPSDLDDQYKIDPQKAVTWGFIQLTIGDFSNKAIETGAYARYAYALALSKYNTRNKHKLPNGQYPNYIQEDYVQKVLGGMNNAGTDGETIQNNRNKVHDIAISGEYNGQRIWK